MKKYERQDHLALAAWAADCAERVLDLFEHAYPLDDRPRRAIEECRMWVRTGVFKMAVIRRDSLSAHAAAREAKDNSTACFAARSAGQAVAAAHVPQHAFGAAYYALKALAASDPIHAESKVLSELDWQIQKAPKNLDEEILKRIQIRKGAKGIAIKIVKGMDF